MYNREGRTYRLFPITISVDNETLKQLDRLAEERKNGNRSALVRDLIADAAQPNRLAEATAEYVTDGPDDGGK